MGRSHKVPYQSMSIRLSKYALCPTQNSLPHIEFRAPHTNLHQAGDRCFKDLFNISQKRDGGERARGGEGLENLQSSEQWVVALGRREKVWLEFVPLSSTTKFTTILLGKGGGGEEGSPSSHILPLPILPPDPLIKIRNMFFFINGGGLTLREARSKSWNFTYEEGGRDGDGPHENLRKM